MSGQPTLDPAYISNLSKVFSADDTFGVVGRDICLLTCLLSGVRDGSPYSSPPHSGDLSTWAHLAYILQLSPNSDPAAAKVVAVTGHISPARVVYAVASRNTQEAYTPENKFTELLGGTESDAENLLFNGLDEIQSRVDFSQHVREVHTIFNYIVSGPHNKNTVSLVEGLTAFVLRRNFSKLSRRIGHAKYEWGSNPLVIIQKYYKESPEARETAGSGRVALSGNIIRGVLLKYHIQPVSSESSGRPEYEFGPANVLTWTNVLVDMLSYLEDGMRLPSGNATQSPPIMRIVDTLLVLHKLFRSKIMELLLVPPVLTQLVVATITQKAARRQRSGGAAVHDDADVEGDDSNADDPDIAMEKHVVRYLQTLTIPYTAAKELVSRASKFWKHTPSVTMYHVEMKPREVDFDQGDVEDFKARFMKCWSSAQQDSASNYFRRQDIAVRHLLAPNMLKTRPSIHAEATLMALASACGQDSKEALSEWAAKLGDVSSEIFQSMEITVGTSKKCCRCCELLRTHLQARVSNVSFTVSGSHATIYPWAPPPVGVPRLVLVEIRRQLLISLGNQVTRDAFVDLKSNQTSPASSTSTLDCEETSTALLSHMEVQGPMPRTEEL